MRTRQSSRVRTARWRIGEWQIIGLVQPDSLVCYLRRGVRGMIWRRGIILIPVCCGDGRGVSEEERSVFPARNRVRERSVEGSGRSLSARAC